MMLFSMHPCEHGKITGCLKCGHRHSENPTKICHKDHRKEYQKMAKEVDKEFKEFMKKEFMKKK